MLKNTKRIFALMLAVALVVLSMFTGVVSQAVCEGTTDLLEFGDYLIEAGSTSKYYDTNVADNGETGTAEDPIIIDTAEEFVYLAKASGDDTAGKYYKVADGIAAFDLSKGDLDLNGTLADNLDKINSSGKNHSGNAPGFQGNFDGNGVTVYGAWCSNTSVSPYAGLFSYTKGDVTIKNVNVKFGSFTGTNAVGGIVGYHKGDGTNTLIVENCSVVDSYLELTQTNGGLGAIVGKEDNLSSYQEGGKTVYVNGEFAVLNCFVDLDENYFNSQNEQGVQTDPSKNGIHGGIAGWVTTNDMMASSCIVIGIKPYASTTCTSHNQIQHSGHKTNYSNIYTDQPAGSRVWVGGTTDGGYQNFDGGYVTQRAKSQMQGVTAADNLQLDWSIWMPDKNGYPELRANHKNVSVVDNKNGTHSEVCECGFGGLSVEHNFIDGVCDCGAKLNCANRKTIGWEGAASPVSNGSGTKEDPYIIKSAAELAWLVQQKADVTAGKYYKVDDSIGEIVLQSVDKAEEIKALADSAAVKEYFENGTFTPWKTMGWEQSCFAGNFDGNGVTIYGLYANTNVNAALFATVDGGAVIKNIAVKNSYLVSSGTFDVNKNQYAYYQVAGIAGVTSGLNYGTKTNGYVWFDSCIVANNYMYNAVNNSNDRSGVIIGGSSDLVYIDNCLVYGNDATYGAGVEMPVWASANNSVMVSSSPAIPEGLEVVVDNGAQTPYYYNMMRNTITFGAAPYDLAQNKGSRFNDPKCFVNVLTDADVENDKFVTGDTINAAVAQIKTITVADLATLDLADAFIKTGSYPELKSFHDDIVPVASDTTHTWKCSGCDLVASGSEAHTFVLQGDKPVGDGTDVYKCSACEYVCTHKNQSVPGFEEGDCVTPSGTYARCKNCDWYFASGVGQASGHKLTYFAEDDGNCEVNGHLEYWGCSTCNNKFASDDIWAPMNTALSDEELDKGLGDHITKADKNGVIIFYDENGHWYECSVNNGRLDFDSNVLEENTVVEHVYNKEFTCEDCGYVCVDHTLEVSKLVVVGNCATDEKSELKCKCGYKTIAVTRPAGHEIVKVDEVAPDDKMEGTKSHYKCNRCNSIFVDAEGKTPATKAGLIIAKTLPAEYNLLPNGDTSDKSPSTGDSFASVMAMAVLSGAVLTLRKAK